eukprot:3321361-Prymnesium_polylepis.1
MHTQIVADRRRLAKHGGAVIFYWLRGHSGVLCNQYADAVATVFLNRPVREDAHLLSHDAARHGAAVVRYDIRAGGLAEPSGRLARRAGRPPTARPGTPATGWAER